MSAGSMKSASFDTTAVNTSVVAAVTNARITVVHAVMFPGTSSLDASFTDGSGGASIGLIGSLAVPYIMTGTRDAPLFRTSRGVALFMNAAGGTATSGFVSYYEDFE